MQNFYFSMTNSFRKNNYYKWLLIHFKTIASLDMSFASNELHIMVA